MVLESFARTLEPYAQRGGAIGGIAATDPSRREASCFSVLRLDNYPQIGTVYGTRTAELVVDFVVKALARLCENQASAQRLSGGGAQGCIEVAVPCCGDEARVLIHAECVKLATTPISVEGNAIIPSISVVYGDANVEGVEAAGNTYRALSINNIAEYGVSCAPYEVNAPLVVAPSARLAVVRDMAAVAALLEAVAGKPKFAWQPVMNCHKVSEVYYLEAQLHIDDEAVSLDQSLQAAERLGCVQALDCLAVLQVLDELTVSSRVRLAANISAQSARQSFWWDPIISRLEKDRSVASRLFIEIRGTSQLPSISEISGFVNKLGALGCNVVMAQFGTGVMSPEAMAAIEPGIIKLDQSFVKKALLTKGGMPMLTHLYGLANAIAPHVIVPGIETERHSSLAKALGAFLQQGTYWAAPDLESPWQLDALAAARAAGAICSRDSNVGSSKNMNNTDIAQKLLSIPLKRNGDLKLIRRDETSSSYHHANVNCIGLVTLHTKGKNRRELWLNEMAKRLISTSSSPISFERIYWPDSRFAIILVCDDRVEELASTIQKYRLQLPTTAIISVMRRASHTACAKLLNKGADDVLDCAMSPDEALCRIFAVQRRLNWRQMINGFQSSESYRLGIPKLARIPLSETEVKLLSKLSTAGDNVVPVEDIMNAIGGQSMQSIPIIISRLRKKLVFGVSINNKYRCGYRLTDSRRAPQGVEAVDG